MGKYRKEEMKEKLKLYSKAKLIDIIEKLSVEYAIKNQQYEYLRHNGNNKLQERIDKAIEYIEDNVSVYAFNNKRLPHWEMNDDEIKELLDILKGSDKE